MNQVLQSGQVTPLHLAALTTDSVIQDSGVTFQNTQALFRADITAVNFNQINFDNQILINLPVGYTRWRCDRVVISGASGSISTATAGLFTGAGATGTQLVASGSTITVTANTIDTNNNMQSMTIANQNTLALSDTAVYWRNQVAEGSAQTANVSIFYEPLP